ncbi:MAG: biopolymer transporter ExbD [Spirochaetales bacterium]|nr:biopolymer transporter ExbD [Spirochaetales bacterium]
MRFKRALETKADVNLVPMIDVVFQLVLFFMVSTTLIIAPGISLVLPDSTTSEQVAMTRLLITVVSRDELYLNKDKHDLAGLDKALSAIGETEKTAIKSVIVEGDRSVSYELMVNVLDILRKNGFKGVNLKTRQVK